MTIEARLAELGLSLPASPAPGGNYVRAKQVGSLLFLAGHGPRTANGFLYLGKVGAEVTPEQAYECARVSALNGLASAHAALGTLDRVVEVVKLLGFVASAPGFNQQPQVINGASDLLVALFGEAGRHARSAVGVAELPNNMPVEVEMILEVREP